MRESYIWDNLYVDVLRLDYRIGRRLVQAEGVVIVQFPSFCLLCFILHHSACALALLARCAVVKRRDVMAIADLRA